MFKVYDTVKKKLLHAIISTDRFRQFRLLACSKSKKKKALISRETRKTKICRHKKSLPNYFTLFQLIIARSASRRYYNVFNGTAMASN